MKPTRFLVLTDTHGDHQHRPTIDAALEFNRTFKADLRLHLGDLFDFRSLRRAAGEQEKRERPDQDIAAGLEILRRFRPTHWMRGNHDERLYDLLESDTGRDVDWARRCVSDIEKAAGPAAIYPYDRRKGVFRKGPMAFLHGFTHGVNAVKAAAQAYGLCLMGHIHAPDSQTIAGIDRRTGFSSGCACELDPGYARANLASLRHCHGFAYGFIFRDDADVYLAREVQGRYHLPSEWREHRV